MQSYEKQLTARITAVIESRAHGGICKSSFLGGAMLTHSNGVYRMMLKTHYGGKVSLLLLLLHVLLLLLLLLLTSSFFFLSSFFLSFSSGFLLCVHVLN